MGLGGLKPDQIASKPDQIDYRLYSSFLGLGLSWLQKLEVNATGKKGNLTMHATSNVHIMACAMWKDYIDSSSTGTVLEMQSKAHRQWVIDNRLYLHSVIDAVLYLSRQG